MLYSDGLLCCYENQASRLLGITMHTMQLWIGSHAEIVDETSHFQVMDGLDKLRSTVSSMQLCAYG